MTFFIIGFCLAGIGVTALNAISDIIIAATELVKASISYRIMQYNTAIEELQNPSQADPQNVKAIGFAANFEEEDCDEH